MTHATQGHSSSLGFARFEVTGNSRRAGAHFRQPCRIHRRYISLLGFYILADAFAHPIEAGAEAVISAVFIIALAAILLFFLIKPLKRSRTS